VIAVVKGLHHLFAQAPDLLGKRRLLGLSVKGFSDSTCLA
jgi:hypothetical protein